MNNQRLVSAYWGDYYPFHNIGFGDYVEAKDPNELRVGDTLVVWGGEDIHPSLYNKGLSRFSGAWGNGPSKRDMIEWNLMREAARLNVPIIGVCRGGQMLTALAGGYLIQHVNNHSGYHEVKTNDGKELMVNSIHHQMMVPDGTNHELVAWVPEPRSTEYWDENNLVNRTVEPEFIYYPDIRGFAIQWHPEMMDENCDANDYVLNFIKERI